MEWNNELALSGGHLSAADRAQGSIFFVGNATVILALRRVHDPDGSELLAPRRPRHLGHGMTAARRTDPVTRTGGVAADRLRNLSHMHEDHFDREVDANLDRNCLLSQRLTPPPT